MKPSHCVAALGTGLMICVGAQAQGGWTVTSLHPAGATSSRAFGVSGSQQVGRARINGREHACMWSGTAASWVDLHPAGSRESEAYATNGSQQVGFADVFGFAHASLWNGTAASWVDLHSESVQSFAVAFSGSKQVGYRGGRAGLWSSTAASWVNLHPAGATESRAFAANGSQQAGWVGTIGNEHASLWSGTADSWIDLHPPSYQASVILGASGSQQVGRVQPHSVTLGVASLWNGTAASWVSLAVPSTSYSAAYATNGSQQVGHATFTGFQDRAILWSGTASSWVDLHPAGFLESYARGIFTEGIHTYVVGYGYHWENNRYEALLWTNTQECSGDLNSDGVVDLSDLAGLLAHFGTSAGATRADGDLDGDGDVDLADLATLLANFGASCR